MHRLEITGATPEELFMNSVRMLSVLLKGGAQTTELPVEPARDAPSDNGSSPKVEHDGSTPSGADQKTKGKRAAKLKVETLPNDPLPDVMTGKTIDHDDTEIGGKPAPELTLDGDVRPMLRAIQKSCTERGKTMPECVEYIMKLYGPFGVQKADQLKPAQFAEFMEAAEGYIGALMMVDR